MFGFSPGELMNLCPDERLLFVRMISAMLRRSGGDAGAVMFEAYRHIGVSLEIGNFCTLSALFNQSWFVRG